MLSKTTVDVASQLAAALTERNVVLSVKGGNPTPLSVMANHLEVGAPGLRRQLTDAGCAKLSAQFLRMNQSEGDTASSVERDELVSLIVKGQQAILTKVRQEIIPKCKEIKGRLDEVIRNEHPNIIVKSVAPPAFLDNDAFVNHIGSYPNKHVLKGEYRSFSLSFPEVEQMIEWAAATPHFDDEEVKTWALEKLTDEKIRYVFGTLFDNSRVMSYHDIPFLRSTNLFMESDELVLAYFLTAYLHDNPQTVRNESVTLDEWEYVLEDLHQLIGIRIFELLKLRQRYYKDGRLILKSSVESVGTTHGHMHVFVNGDLFSSWVSEGGDVKTLLGAAMFEPGRATTKELSEKADMLVNQWDRKHAVIRSQFKAETTRRRRSDIQHAVLDVMGYDNSDQESRYRLREKLGTIKDSDLDNLWGVVFDVVCEVYYPNPIYRQFLDSMSYFSNKVSDSREAALLANIEVFSRWFRTMVTWDHFESDIVDSEESQEEQRSDEPQTTPEG